MLTHGIVSDSLFAIDSWGMIMNCRHASELTVFYVNADYCNYCRLYHFVSLRYKTYNLPHCDYLWTFT